jgi:hypothetical protein
LAEAERVVPGLLAVAAVVSVFGLELSGFAALVLVPALGLAAVDFDALLDGAPLDLSESAAAIVLLAFASDVEVSGLAAGFVVDLPSLFVADFVSAGVSVRADIEAGGSGAGIVVDASFLSALDLSLAVVDLSAVALDADLSPDDLSLTD